MPKTTLTLSSKNYSSWSLRGWLMAKFAGIKFDEIVVEPNDADARAEILLLSPSILVPCLTYAELKIWDTLAIGEFLNEVAPKASLLPKDRAKRAHCRSVCGEMHSGFVSLRQALPMNIRAEFPDFKIWSKAKADIERILAIWRECLAAYGGPFLFGEIAWLTRCTRRWSAVSAPTASGSTAPSRPTPTASGNAGDVRMARSGARREGRDRGTRSRVLTLAAADGPPVPPPDRRGCGPPPRRLKTVPPEIGGRTSRICRITAC